MSTSTSTSTAPAAGTKTKLRQTCDPCSEAKVKCDKGNPRCGRCDRLSFDCVYSPARRIGRPRPRPRSPDRERADRERDRERNRDRNRDREREIHVAASSSSSSRDRDRDYPAAAAPPSAPTPPAHRQSQSQQLNLNLSLLDVPLPDLPDLPIDSRLSDEGDASASASTSARSNTSSNDAPHSTNLTITGSLGGMGMDDVEEVQHSPYEDDCAIVAVATLRRISAGTSPATDVLAEQIPFACRQAARMLVCPCSTDLDTALLVASLAAAILDAADTALRALKPAGHALDDEQHTVLALGTLPNISQVVTLFTHRYSVTQASRPPEALLLLAASLRTTLKTLAEDTTNRFLDRG
ncbi:hypothetical protein B0T16DRAFT_427583 [Cercophora newfieldiana]|uniref:Zn(2)-C6 fungal-type domain-containing protein n=1 Tax=Cercophora newfieldiana TaxID=92897 RepID=A0AA40CTG2_9PEZI|nr:hypothetical protein B0T16DRAFT_427583 [Cercophora newfieldiana]